MMLNIRILYLLLLASLLCTACHNNEPRYRIGVSQCSHDAWRQQMNNEIMREARLYEGVEVTILCAHDDNKQQAKDIEQLLEKQINLLIVAPNQSNPITPVVEEVYRKGIPVVVVDRKIDSDQYTAYVGGDNYEVGKAAAHYMAKALQGKGKVIEIKGLEGSSPATERHRGFNEVMKQWPYIEVVASVWGDWGASKARQQIDSLIRQGVQADMIYAQNDVMAFGASQATQAARIPMRFVGTDANAGPGNGIEAVLQGWLEVTFLYPTGGDKAMEVAMQILQGKTFPRHTILNTVPVNSDNVELMQMQTNRIAQLDTKIEHMGNRFNHYVMRYDNQQTILTMSLVVLALLVGSLIMLYLFIRTKNKKNRLLESQKLTLEEQKQKLEVQKLQLESQTNQLIEQQGTLIEQKRQLEEQTTQLMQQTQQLIEQEKLLKEATQAKLNFFTNISHDFRTPLTLIEAPVEELLTHAELSAVHRRLLEMMRKNVHILLRLVSQILDFRKIENGHMELHLSTFDLADCFRNWADSFHMTLLQRHIKLDIDIPAHADFHLQADREKMERIYFNLLSNALKYTPPGGDIKVSMAIDSHVRFSVFNSGSHLSPQEAQAVFERFYQADNAREGTGIGLALARSFAELHGGDIEAFSDKQGTTFEVTLPLSILQSVDTAAPAETNTTTSHSPGTPILVPTSMALHEGKTLLQLEHTPLDTETDSIDPDSPLVLVIDDNTDICSFLSFTLGRHYRVLTANDGEQGLKLAMKYVPDVIVSDVMMPVMDGHECCRRLKSEMQTSHIPVILLTACSLEEQRIQGYDCGADSYISKPFNASLLLSRIQNLLNSRRQLKQQLADNQSIERADLSDLDKEFTARFKRLVEERMGQADLNVEDIGRELGMSRVQLYRKLKQLTNFSPVELLRQIRLKRAASLLSTTELTISQIAYEVGFSSPSYFTKCYKEEFGISPSEAIKRKN